MASTAEKTGWVGRIGKAALFTVVATIVAALIAVTLARYDIIGKLPGFLVFMGTQVIMLVAGAVGLLALIFAMVRKSGPKGHALTSVILATIMIGAIYFIVIMPGASAPAMHDITTDVDDPPEFRTLSLREDNLVPFNNIEEWRAAHREGYPDIGPIVIDRAPNEVLAQARALAEERGWEIANVDTANGHMEATAFAGYIRFRDDVIIETTPIADGSTRVDMRSVSRVGVGDLGYNAARIEEFLAALKQAN